MAAKKKAATKTTAEVVSDLNKATTFPPGPTHTPEGEPLYAMPMPVAFESVHIPPDYSLKAQDAVDREAEKISAEVLDAEAHGRPCIVCGNPVSPKTVCRVDGHLSK